MSQQQPNLGKITNLLNQSLNDGLQKPLLTSIVDGLGAMLDVFFHPGEASMLRAKTSTVRHGRDAFILLLIVMATIMGLHVLDILLTLIVTPTPHTALDLIATFIVSALVIIVAVVGTLTQNLIVTSILVWLATRHWHQKRVYFFISVLYVTPFFALMVFVDIFITALPLFTTPYETVDSERITSIIFSPVPFYLLYLHYQNLKVSFNLTGPQAVKVIFFPLFMFMALLFVATIGFMIFLVAMPLIAILVDMARVTITH